MKEIKVCPFCGSNRFSIALINVEHTNHNSRIGTFIVRDAPPAVQIRCKDCGASMAHTFGVKDEVYRQIDIINEVTDSLIDKWNTRYQDRETQLKAERLNRLAEWENELDNKDDDLKEREEQLDNRAIRNTEWEQELNNREEAIKSKELNCISLKNWNEQLKSREKYLIRRDLEIGEKLQRMLEIRDEFSKLLETLDTNSEEYNKISEALKSSED